MSEPCSTDEVVGRVDGAVATDVAIGSIRLAGYEDQVELHDPSIGFRREEIAGRYLQP